MSTTISLPRDVFDWRRECPEYTPTVPVLADVRAVVYARANRVNRGGVA